jgi:hypothetical protein
MYSPEYSIKTKIERYKNPSSLGIVYIPVKMSLLPLLKN